MYFLPLWLPNLQRIEYLNGGGTNKYFQDYLNFVIHSPKSAHKLSRIFCHYVTTPELSAIFNLPKLSELVIRNSYNFPIFYLQHRHFQRNGVIIPNLTKLNISNVNFYEDRVGRVYEDNSDLISESDSDSDLDSNENENKNEISNSEKKIKDGVMIKIPYCNLLELNIGLNSRYSHNKLYSIDLKNCEKLEFLSLCGFKTIKNIHNLFFLKEVILSRSKNPIDVNYFIEKSINLTVADSKIEVPQFLHFILTNQIFETNALHTSDSIEPFILSFMGRGTNNKEKKCHLTIIKCVPKNEINNTDNKIFKNNFYKLQCKFNQDLDDWKNTNTCQLLTELFNFCF